MGRVVVLGSSNVDLTVIASHLPAPGETVLGHTFVTGPGGKGSNQAIGARRLGADVTFVTKVGDDRAGADLRALLQYEGIPLAGVLTTMDAPTGIALIVVDDDGRNMIAVAPGANATLSPADVAAVPGLFDGASHLLCQLESPIETVLAATTAASASGVVVVLDPAPARGLHDGVYPLIDVMTPNQTELAALTGMPIDTESAVEAAARRLLERGIGTVVATLGDRGCMAVRPGDTLRMPARAVRAVDTTGCGDAFDAGLVTGLAAGLGLPDALDLATRAGAFCATRRGVLEGLPSRSDLDRELPR
jgi:ribokinase